MALPNLIAAEAIRCAAEGGKVAFVAGCVVEVRPTMYAIEDALGDDSRVVRISHANGREAIGFESGGSIQFFRNSVDLRGFSADQAYVSFGAVSKGDIENIRPCLAGSADGTLAGFYA